MRASENRIAPIAAFVAMFIVSVTIVGLTYWSGDLFGPWTSVPPVIVEQRGVEAVPSMLKPAGGADSGEAAFHGSRGKNAQNGMRAAAIGSGASARSR